MTDYRTVPVELLNSAAGLLHNGGFFALADALNGIINASPAPAGDLSVDDLVDEARFLIDRLTDFENRIESDEDAREFHGHVSPSVARLRALIAAMQPGWRDKPHCQSCGGEIQGWTCQGCGLTFRENEGGRLVAEPLLAPPGVGG
jgi:hypothetical protein